MTEHPQVELEIDGRIEFVDEELAPLIAALWRLGVSTAYSCQDATPPARLVERDGERQGYVQIVFPDAEELRKLLSLLPESDLLHSAFQFPRGARWQYTLRPRREPSLLRTYTAPPLRLQVSAFIPREQLQPLVDALQQACNGA